MREGGIDVKKSLFFIIFLDVDQIIEKTHAQKGKAHKGREFVALMLVGSRVLVLARAGVADNSFFRWTIYGAGTF